MWKLVSVRLEVVLVSAQDRCTVALNVPRQWKSIWAHPMVLLANGGEEEAHFIRLEIVLISSQDRCMVCTECTTCVEITLGTPEWYS